MSEMKCDILVIGGGPGGYVAAIRAAQLGYKVICVDKNAALGGTCLNVGCIPSKALLHSSHLYRSAHLNFADIGIELPEVRLNLEKMMAHKTTLIQGLNKGITQLFKKNGVVFVEGQASFVSEKQVQVKGPSQTRITMDYCIIATGSEVAYPSFISLDEETIVSSTGALKFSEVPKTLLVMGGGYIGLEMASVWNNLGAKVTVVEAQPSIVPAMDKDIQNTLIKSLKQQGIEFLLNTKITKIEKNQIGAAVTLENGSILEVEKVLIAVGRRPVTQGLNLEAAGVKIDAKGYIETNHWQTTTRGIYAIGDVTQGPMLAHKAEEEGVAAIETIAGQKPHIAYHLIPSVIYTSPEAASVGLTEKEVDINTVNIGIFPFSANSRARAINQKDGLVKIIADKKTDRVLGVHIVGNEAGILIAEAVVAMEYSASSEDIARICHAHPTLNEAIKESALAVLKRSIHM